MDALGFVGLGSMGGAIAARIAASGRPVVATDRSQAAQARAAGRGATIARDVAEVCARTRVIALSLPEAGDVRDVVAGDGGILAHAQPGTLVIDATTSDPATSRALAARLAEAGHAFLDAPVSGLPLAAEAGTLAFMIGGEAADVERARPWLEPVAGAIVHVGPSGAGNVAKIANNLVAASNLLVLSEAARLAGQAGVDLDGLVAALNVSSGRSWASEVLFPRFVLTGGYDAGFSARLMRKDLRLATALMDETRSRPGVTGLAGAIWARSPAYRPDDADLTEMARAVIEAGATEAPEAG